MNRRDFLAAASVFPACATLTGSSARTHQRIVWKESGELFVNHAGVVLETCRIGDSWLLEVSQLFDGRLSAVVCRKYAVDYDPYRWTIVKAKKASCRNVAEAKQWCLDTLHSIAEERRDDAMAVLEILETG